MAGQDQLRARGLRVTRPRLTVLAILEEHRGGHLHVEEIAALVRERLDSVSTQAVYDVLSALTRVGLARRVEPAGSPARFEAGPTDNHHHLVCRTCGTIVDVQCASGETPHIDPQCLQGFRVDEAEITFWGLCPECQMRPVAPPAPARPTGVHRVVGQRVSTADHGSRVGASAPAGHSLR